MAREISGEEWQRQQDEVWGRKDPEVWTRVVQRIQRQEPEVLAEVERMMRDGVPPHALLKYVTNSILRGVDSVELSVKGMTCEEYAAEQAREELAPPTEPA